MKFGSLYWVLLSFFFVIISRTAGAHPHELGKMDHGPSLESYQVNLDFTTNGSTKGGHNPGTTLAQKDQTDDTSKRNKSVRTKELDKLEEVKEDKDQKQKEQ